MRFYKVWRGLERLRELEGEGLGEVGMFCEAGSGQATISFGPSGVRALPLAAGRNEGGHYFR